MFGIKTNVVFVELVLTELTVQYLLTGPLVYGAVFFRILNQKIMLMY